MFCSSTGHCAAGRSRVPPSTRPMIMTSREFRGVPLNNEISAPLSRGAVTTARPAAWMRTAGIVVAGSALVAICAHIALPLYFTPVPLSLAPFAVLLLGLLLSPRLAFATLAAYLAEGALGLPVFAPSPLFAGGLGHLLGPTGGYLLAYPLAAPLISLDRQSVVS